MLERTFSAARINARNAVFDGCKEVCLSSVPLSVRTRLLGVGVVLAGVVFQALWLGLPAIFVSIGLVISYGFWVGAGWRFAPRLKVVFFIAVFVFVGHAAEEFLTGFQQDLPALFGRAPWSDQRFIIFNGLWALVFAAAAFTVTAVRPLPVLIILFFAVVGGVGNGVAHLLLVLQRGAYFPGAWTAPVCLVMGIWLLRLLYTSDRPSGRTTNS